MKKDFGFRDLNLPRPVYLKDDSVQVDVENNVVTAKALFPSSDPSLGDRKDGHVNLQHLHALGSNLFHVLIAAHNDGKIKKARVASDNGSYAMEVRQDTEIDVSLSYRVIGWGNDKDTRMKYRGLFIGKTEKGEHFRIGFDVVVG